MPFIFEFGCSLFLVVVNNVMVSVVVVSLMIPSMILDEEKKESIFP